ncbi:MAG: AsmA-like C-terminal region-containing protein [Phycisphaeraceae bacterium]
MKRLKRTTLGFAALLVLLAGGVVALVVVVGGAGESAIETWVGGELKQVAGAHLKPQLEFDSLDYQAPRTVVLTNVRLSADDPDHANQRVNIIDAKRIEIELAELPKRGEPVRLKSVRVDGASVRLVASRAGGLVGFSDFLVDQTPGDAPPLSEVLQITEIIIRDGAIEYDARTPDTAPMRFDKIDTELQIAEHDAGTYKLDLELARENVLDLTLDADADLNNLKLAVSRLTTELDVAREQDRYLPPQVQAFIRQYDLVGVLSMSASGELDLNDVAGSTSDLTLTLADAHGTAGGYRLPIKTLTVEAKLADRYVTVKRLAGELLGGEISGDGGVALGDDMPAKLNLSGNGLLLDELAQAQNEGEAPPIAGKVALQLDAQAPLTRVLEQMTGEGELRIRDGRIARLPLVSDLVEFLESAGDIDPKDAQGKPAGRDKADVVFTLKGDHAQVSKADIEGTWFGLRAQGQVFLTGRLKMNMNAGPLEKFQQAIGAIGRPFGALTDALLTYRVTGPMDDLNIRPVPLGGIIGVPGERD